MNRITHLFCVFIYTYAPFVRFFATQKAYRKAVGFLCWWGMVVGPPNAKVADPCKPRLHPIRPLSFEVRISQSDLALRRSGHESTIRAKRGFPPTNSSLSLLITQNMPKSTCMSALIYDCAIFVALHALTNALQYVKINQ